MLLHADNKEVRENVLQNIYKCKLEEADQKHTKSNIKLKEVQNTIRLECTII